jgi:hypothetical protein
MTLLTTEIVVDPHPMIVFAADRRISLGGRRHAERRKILRVTTKRAGIGYFGLAELSVRGRQLHMDVWLADFLEEHSSLRTLRDLAAALEKELNHLVPAATRRAHISGFHLAGFNDRHQPEFWFVRNVADDQTTVLGDYKAREDFQRRDRAKLPPGAAQIYRNGDLRAHAAVWENIDTLFSALLRLPDFTPGAGPVQYMRWVQFKMETIAHFYQRFCHTSIIGKPVDTFVITHTGVLFPRTGPR